MASYNMGSIGSGNGLLSDGTKPLLTNVDSSPVRSSGIRWRVISLEMLKLSILLLLDSFLQ